MLDIQTAEPVYVQIERNLRQKIQTGQIPPLTRLPSTTDVESSSGGYPPWVQLSQIKNPTNTIMVGDTNDAWVGSGEEGVDSYPVFYICQFGKIDPKATRHASGGNSLWVDGHISWHSATEIQNSPQWFYIE